MLSETSLLSSVLWEMESVRGVLTEVSHRGAAEERHPQQLTRRNSPLYTQFIGSTLKTSFKEQVKFCALSFAPLQILHFLTLLHRFVFKRLQPRRFDVTKVSTDGKHERMRRRCSCRPPARRLSSAVILLDSTPPAPTETLRRRRLRSFTSH